MANNTLFISTTANDTTGAIGDPTHPFSLDGAVNKVNTMGGTVTWFLDLGRGTFNLACPQIVPLRANIVFSGMGPKNTIINAYEFSVENGSKITFQSCGLRTCSSKQLFHIRSGSVNLTSTDIIVSNGTLVRFVDGVLMINGSSVQINAATSNPIVNATGGALLVNTTNFFFRMPGPLTSSTSLIGTTSKSLTSVLNNVGVVIETQGGSGNVIPFYNVPIVNNSIVQMTSPSPDNGLILFALDIMPTGISDTPYYGVNINVSAQGAGNVYTSYNMNQYPLILRNITWNGMSQQPGVFTRGTPTVGAPGAPSPVSATVNTQPASFTGVPPAGFPPNMGPGFRGPPGFGGNPNASTNRTGSMNQPGFSNNMGPSRNYLQEGMSIETDYAPLNQQRRDYGGDIDAWTQDQLDTNDMESFSVY